MSAQWDALYEFSKTLEDDHIDEDHSELEIPSGDSTRTVQNLVIRVRGKRNGVPLVVTYSTHLLQHGHHQHVLDVFVTGRAITFEGLIRRRTWWDKILAWFGKGGLQGDHPLFKDCRVKRDEPCSEHDFAQTAFSDGLHRLAQRPDFLFVELQNNAGVNSYHRFGAGTGSADALRSLVDHLERTVAALPSNGG